MNEQNASFIIKYIKTKKKLRKIVTYNSENPELKIKHEKIAAFLNSNFTPSKFTKAYVKNKSIYHNAKPHMYNDIFISLDIKDFFGNINHKLLINALYYELNKKDEDTINKLECGKIVSHCSISEKGIPLGFITSPILSNIYLKEFDNILYGKLKKLDLRNVIYTRYADDLVISFKNFFIEDAKFKNDNIDYIISIVQKLLSRFNLKLNPSKTRRISFEKSNHVKITGVNITRDACNQRKLSVGRKLKNDLFHMAIKCHEQEIKDQYEVMKLKGLESFIFSIEKKGYEEIFSVNMTQKIEELGFASLHDLIKNMRY
ncbi:reverse transcriptase domain-containing protein [Priestia megaterium]|uniref:reverse transcriptase domain-containing protein n=1 Tax=Priestia megaterium TaxID=1404 RepID=UPI00296FBCC5|nr:reverse transcriptase domain-containing protein [Priestia megaterium]MDW4511854.1 reverse transcriptase domain-containing protein [Priestia megaterium]